MNYVLKVAGAAVFFLILSITNAEACHRMRRQACESGCCQPAATCCQPVSGICPAPLRGPAAASDCQDDNGHTLQKGWYWQAYYFATNKTVKIGPFTDEATCKQNEDMTCPSSNCCPAMDPYFCPGPGPR